MADNTHTEKFVADVAAFVRDVQKAAHESDRFGTANSEAGLAARRMGLAAQEAGQRAQRASLAAFEAAKKLERGELDVAKAAELAAKASNAVERASIKQAEASKAAARAADEEAQQLHQLGRAAAEAAAMEELGRLRASKSINDHNALLSRMRRDYQGFGNDVKEMGNLGQKAFGMLSSAAVSADGVVTKAGQALSESGPLMIGGIVAAIALLPPAAIAASGAVTLALGGGLAAVGVMGALQATKVRQAFSDLAGDARRQAAEWSKPWEPALIGIAHEFDQVVKGFAPTLTDVFSRMAPTVQTFASHLADSMYQLQPALTDVGNAFDKILEDLGPNLPAIMGSLSDAISTLAQTASAHSRDIVQFVMGFAQLVDWTSKAIQVLAEIEPMIDPVSNLFDILGVGARSASEGLAALGTSEVAAAVKAVDLSGATSHVQNVMDLASQSAQQLKTSLDALTGKELTAREAAAQYGTAVINMTKALRDNGAAHGFATAKGIANEQALTQLSQAAQADAEAMRNNGASARDVAKFMDSARQKIYNAAREMGYGKQAAQDLATKLSGISAAAARIPRQITIYFKTNLTGVDPRVNIGSFVNRAQGGPIGHYADGGAPTWMPYGGPISGAGTSTSDSIPAWVSNGEFIVNAAAYQANKTLVNAINAAHGRPVELGGEKSGSHLGPGPKNQYLGAMPLARRHYAETLSGASGGTSQPQVVNHHNFYIAGSVWSEQELLNVLQRVAFERGIDFNRPAGR